MMQKVIFILFLIITISSTVFAEELRTETYLKIPKGTYIRVINQKLVSTQLADEGDIVTFINPTDIWLGETKVIPKRTIFEGFIEELNEPVQGTNGALKIKMNKLILPQGDTLDMDAYVTLKGSSTIGGEMTPPMEYAKMPHYINYPGVYKGVLQYVPGKKKFFGQHTVIKPGAELVLELNEDLKCIDTDY